MSHLGSNRMIVDRNGRVEQVNHYYPYGGVIGGIDLNPTAQQFKYEGKELDNTLGLDWYDIHARQYDPIVPSWNAVDPQCEKSYYLSPYVFCKDNSVNYLDEDGNFPKKEMAIFSWLLCYASTQVKPGPIVDNLTTNNKEFRFTYNSYTFNDKGIEVVKHIHYTDDIKENISKAQKIGTFGNLLGDTFIASAPIVTIIGAAFGSPEFGAKLGEYGAKISFISGIIKNSAEFLQGKGYSGFIEDGLFSLFSSLGGRIIRNILPANDIGREILKQTKDSKIVIIQETLDYTNKNDKDE